jgi:ABC-type xylose transport system permease subunit
VLILPTPGGKAPEWVRGLMTLKPALVPLPIIAAAAIALLAHLGLMSTAYGAVLRGAGGNPKAIERAGWSLLTVKMVMFGLAGLFGAGSPPRPTPTSPCVTRCSRSPASSSAAGSSPEGASRPQGR